MKIFVFILNLLVLILPLFWILFVLGSIEISGGADGISSICMVTSEDSLIVLGLSLGFIFIVSIVNILWLYVKGEGKVNV